MANFTTHIATGIVTGGMLSTLAMAASAVTPTEVMTLTLTCGLGAVLPDIDLQKSRASQAMFSGLGVFFAFAMLFNWSMALSIAEMWILWVGTYFVVRYLGHNLFHRISVHRGVFHSLIAAVFFALVTAIAYQRLFAVADTLAWLAAAFMFVGFVSHLVLDEIYSVDVFNERIKASFGTAFKLFDGGHPLASAGMAASIVGVFMLTPPFDGFVKTFGSGETWTGLGQRLLPEHAWFGFDLKSATATASQTPMSAASTIEPATTVGPAKAANPVSTVAR